MKNIFRFLMTAFMAVSVFASCQKDVDTSSSIIDGEWHTTMTVGAEGAEETVADVYIQFADGGFTLYQKTGTMVRYYIYEGTFTLTDDLLNGQYSDGTPWGASYKVSVNGDVLTMAAQNDSKESVVYKREAVPADVRKSAVPFTKSEAVPCPIL